MVEHPQAAHGVLDQVTDDPVRGEELGGGGGISSAPAFLFFLNPAKTSSFRSEM